jgi:hypothetical protein
MGTNGFTDHRKTFMGETPDTACTVLCDYCGEILHCEEHDIFWKDTANHKCVSMLEAERDALQAQLAEAVKAALEWAAVTAEGESMVSEVSYTCAFKVSKAIRAAATDPATVAAIIERAGK